MRIKPEHFEGTFFETKSTTMPSELVECLKVIGNMPNSISNVELKKHVKQNLNAKYGASKMHHIQVALGVRL